MFSFPSRSFSSAFLLFQLQPMIGRYILPWFGGGPAVWTSCLLFFQACLLAGYAYAHWLGSLAECAASGRCSHGAAAGVARVSAPAPECSDLEAGFNHRSFRPDLTSANRYSRRSLPVIVCDGAAAAALVRDERFRGRSRQVALAIVCSFKFRIVSRVAELSVRFRAVTAATHARFDLVRPVSGVRRPVRIRGVADAVGSARASGCERRTRSGGAPHRRHCAVLARAFRLRIRRFWWRLPIRSRKTSPSVLSCGWRRSGSICSHSYWLLIATASTGERHSPSPLDFSPR